MLLIHTLHFSDNTESLNKKLKLYQLVISYTFMGIHIYISFFIFIFLPQKCYTVLQNCRRMPRFKGIECVCDFLSWC